MTRKQAEEMAEFESVLCNAVPSGTPYEQCGGMIPAARELMRLARRHGKLQERLCNEPDDNGKLVRADEACMDRIQRLIFADDSPLHHAVDKVVFGGDPRGYTVKVILRNGKYNTWGGAEDGWGVPQ